METGQSEVKKRILSLFVAVVLSASPSFAEENLAHVSPSSNGSNSAGLNWTGLYVGINGGHAWGRAGAGKFCVDSTGVVNGATCQVFSGSERGVASPEGFFGGVQAGYNHQVGEFVVGVEADIQLSDISASRTVNGPFGFAGIPGVALPAGVATTNQKMDIVATARVRLGFLLTDRTLAYVTGGVMGGRVKVNSIFTAPNVSAQFVGSSSSTQFGGAIGGGFEHAFSENWTAKFEALYYDLGETTSFSTTPGNFQHNYRFDNRGVLVRVGLNYLF